MNESTCPGEVVPSRTSGSEGEFCQECGAPVTGRRRNGFCGDRCRMRHRRARKRARVRELFSLAEETLSTLREAVLGGISGKADSDG
jgi:predicted nucleic acid-binding Zn ribbon protein